MNKLAGKFSLVMVLIFLQSQNTPAKFVRMPEKYYYRIGKSEALEFYNTKNWWTNFLTIKNHCCPK